MRFGSISGSFFGLAMGILARLRLVKIRTMARPNSPDMPPKRTKKVRLGIKKAALIFNLFTYLFITVSEVQCSGRKLVSSYGKAGDGEGTRFPCPEGLIT